MIGFGWLTIARLGMVQAAIGSMVMLATSVLNRVMMVELGLAAAIPAGLVAWHYAVQLSRPLWGHGSDRGRQRTPWIVGGMAVLAFGVLLAVDAVALLYAKSSMGYLVAVLGFTLIGLGVGAAGTSLLALLASGVAPARRAPAAAVTWIMMVAGIVVSAIVTGELLKPFSMPRLAAVAGGLALTAFLVTLLAVRGLDSRASAGAVQAPARFADALADIRRDPQASRFTIFVFASMLAYSMQDLILEPFAGLIFKLAPGVTTQLSGVHQGGILIGMIVAGIAGSAFAGRRPAELERWIVGGCLGSGLALLGLVAAAGDPLRWPLLANLLVLGLCNGVFAVSAIGAMMGLAGAGDGRQSGLRMGVWGASQAIAFGTGGLLGAVIVDVARRITGADSLAFQVAFLIEALLFLVAAVLAVRVARDPAKSFRGVEVLGGVRA